METELEKAVKDAPVGEFSKPEARDIEPLTGTDKDLIPLLKKINAAVKDVGWVAKDGRNELQSYNYAQEAGVLAQVRDAFQKNGIVLTFRMDEPTNVRDVPKKNGGVMPITRIKIIFRMSDMETGAWVDTPAYGEGMDSGDKGLYKAITGATKYFLLKTMLMPTGDDPEKDSPADKTKKKVDVKEPSGNGVIDIGVVKRSLFKGIKKLPKESQSKWKADIEQAKTLGQVEALVVSLAAHFLKHEEF